MLKVKQEIEADPKSTPLRKRELWTAVKKSYSPIVFTLLWVTQGVLEIFGPHPPMSLISAARSAILGSMSLDALKLARDGTRKTKQKFLLAEIVTEINNL